MLWGMGRNVIVSEETVRDLLEAHASLSAWYYELWAALRAVNATAASPDDAARAAFVERLAVDFPEVAAIARSLQTPRLYVPAPPPARAGHADPRPPDLSAVPLSLDEPATLIEPAPARVRGATDRPAEKTSDLPPPPPLVDPGSVKYDP
jgi:hypothetical protein